MSEFWGNGWCEVCGHNTPHEDVYCLDCGFPHGTTAEQAEAWEKEQEEEEALDAAL